MLNRGQSVDADRCCEQMDRVNHVLVEKYSVIERMTSVIGWPDIDNNTSQPHEGHRTYSFDHYSQSIPQAFPRTDSAALELISLVYSRQWDTHVPS